MCVALTTRSSRYFTDLEGLYFCFPNIVDLLLYYHNDNSSEEKFARETATTVDLQRSSTEKGWSKLKTLSCSSAYYLVLGLTCKARTWITTPDTSDKLTALYHKVAYMVQPEALSLEFTPRHSMEELCRTPSTSLRVTHLDLSVEVPKYDHSFDHFIVNAFYAHHLRSKFDRL